MQDEDVLKIVILGEGRVGKTSILSKYFSKKFDQSQKSTINPNFYEKTVKYNGKDVKFAFWDTAGQEQFDAISTIYYQDAKGALLVYDVTIFETFKKVKKWVNTLQEAVGKDTVFVIAGNKFDLLGKSQMDEQASEIDPYCAQQNCKHFYTSAKTAFNLDVAFDTLINAVLNKVKPGSGVSNKRGRKLVVSKENKEEKKKGCC